MSKLTEVIQQHERESSRRKALERHTEKLKLEIEMEKERLAKRHEAELQNRRSEWENERSTLLTIIQQECNSVFERKIASFARTTTSPNNSQGPVSQVAAHPNPSLAVDTSLPSGQVKVDSNRSTTSTVPLISPYFSDLDTDLRETEALVQSLF